MGVQVIATSSYLPTSVITNDDWAKRVDTSDEWIVKRTGIKTRYWAKEQTTSDLATIAAKRLVEKSNISPESIEFIIVATMTPDAASPSCASLVQGAIGATNAFAFDVSAACSGFVFALSTGLKMLEHGQRKYGIVIGAETMLSSLDWETAQRLFSLEMALELFFYKKMKSHFYWRKHYKMMDRNLRH